jgi:hypothetical protein
MKEQNIADQNEAQVELETKRMISYVFFNSFGHSQGSQELQVDLISWIGAKLREKNAPLDETLRESMRQWVSKINVPHGHSLVSEDEVREQFSFWWDLMWDVMSYQKAAGKSELPSCDELVNRSLKNSAGEPNWTLAKEKMEKVRERMELNLVSLTSKDKMSSLLLPRLIKVEYSFQVEQPYKETPGRSRTDGGDIFECRMLSNIIEARRKTLEQKELTLYDELYLEITTYLNELLADGDMTPLIQDYLELLKKYNENHPGSELESLFITK